MSKKAFEKQFTTILGEAESPGAQVGWEEELMEEQVCEKMKVSSWTEL